MFTVVFFKTILLVVMMYQAHWVLVNDRMLRMHKDIPGPINTFVKLKE